MAAEASMNSESSSLAFLARINLTSDSSTAFGNRGVRKKVPTMHVTGLHDCVTLTLHLVGCICALA